MKFPKGGYCETDLIQRKSWLSNKYNVSFNEQSPILPSTYRGLIENQVDEIHLPMSVAGPLRINGTYAKGEFYVPLCTLEGTLTLSMTRGFKVTSLSNGIKTCHIKQELSRSPIFIFSDIDYLHGFIKWIENNFMKIKEVSESTTRHGKLIRIDKYPIQNRLILDFVFYTAEAAGQNMVTFATQTAINFIKDSAIPGLKNCFIESNFNGDKNSSHKNLMHGRGHYVIASAVIDNKLIKKFLRVGVDEFEKFFINAYLGSVMAGVNSPNLHVANALSAIYLATGQDIACVAENSLGIVSYENQNGNLYASLTLPSLSIGTVGGGTRLPKQKRNLELLGCSPENKDSSKKLAEIICASALALELSLSGAVGSDEFADAHMAFGRERKSIWPV